MRWLSSRQESDLAEFPAPFTKATLAAGLAQFVQLPFTWSCSLHAIKEACENIERGDTKSNQSGGVNLPIRITL